MTRKLTINRKNTFVASLAKICVYTPSDDGNLVVRGVRSVKLGELKNGKTLIADISTEEQYLLFSYRNFENYSESCPAYTIPAGDKDVSISIKPRFNLFQNKYITPIEIEELIET